MQVSRSTTRKSEAIPQNVKSRHSVEFFHIYSDEKIDTSHKASINYVKSAMKAWDFDYDLLVLIDDYNPDTHSLDLNEVFSYLESQGVPPTHWAREADMVTGAEKVLESLTDNKLKKQYRKYIKTHQKYPCSLLTATWYLTRLGKLSNEAIQSVDSAPFIPSNYLINILPESYKDVEQRALKIIARSTYNDVVYRIQNLYYTSSAHRKLDLF